MATKESLLLSDKNAWKLIQEDYDIGKKAFGRRINFVTDSFKRKILFRDIGHAFMLARIGYNKSAVILAGSIIEELLRLYIESHGISTAGKRFNDYISISEQKAYLGGASQSLSDAVRQFRNIVHIERERGSQDSIKKFVAKNAVSSIFTIASALK